MNICFLFPGHGALPCGGLKVIGEYANRLVADGCSVSIVYAGSLFWRRKSLYFKLTNCVRYMQRLIIGYSCRKWFPLDRRVREVFALSLCQRHVPQADRYVATNPYTAMYLKDYHVDASRCYYFIQDYENWGDVDDATLRKTYHYPLRKIVISNWLKAIMEEENVDCAVIPNGFDFNVFKQTILPAARSPRRVMMLYHRMERKGCAYGFAALKMVKANYPDLQVTVFGVFPRPDDLPAYCEYYQSPDREKLVQLYNESAIYLGCSNIEGWGLTIGEAMICGCAVVCTDNAGYLEMVNHEVNALVSPVRDANGMAHNVMRLFEDQDLRVRLAAAGQRMICRFRWEESYAKFREELKL